MHHFQYRNGVMHAEDVPLPAIANSVGTPFYCYSTATLVRHYRVLADALDGLGATIHYAVKANPNLAVLRVLARLGSGADVVSEGEMRRALMAGIPASKIIFSGVGKTREEMAAALEEGIHQINVESEAELEALNDVALSLGRRAAVAFRVNPDVDARTHAKITTGRKENKFGIEWTRVPEICRRASQMPGIDVVGVAVHIGSQLTELEPFRDAFVRVGDLVSILRADGIDVRRVDLGGGLGVPYDEENIVRITPADYATVVREVIAPLGCAIAVEPGRLLVGNAGVLVTRVIYIKEGETRRFAIVDAGMNDLMRPSLYDAYHAILPVREPAPDAPREPMDVVGPICESSDIFASQRPLPPLASGDLVALMTAGAYGAAMSSTYNTRPLVPEVLVDGSSFDVVRRRPTFEESVALERLPDRFA